MHAVTGYELTQVNAKLVVWTRRNVMKLIDGNQSIIKGLHAEFVDGEAEGRVGTDQNLIVTLKKGAD